MNPLHHPCPPVLLRSPHVDIQVLRPLQLVRPLIQRQAQQTIIQRVHRQHHQANITKFSVLVSPKREKDVQGKSK